MNSIIFRLLFCMVFSVLPVIGQQDSVNLKYSESEKLKKSFAIFDQEEIMEVSLQFDLKSYLKKNFKKPLDAVLTFHISENDSLTKNVKVDNRGTFRSTNCNYPTLEIDFKKPVWAYADMGRIEKLKLVTCCETGDRYNEYVLREYLVYKLFNVLTDSSYRIRLLRLHLVDSRKNNQTITQYGLFLEPQDILAERINSTIVKTNDVGQKHIIPEVIDRLAIFNYMIGNYDWSVKGQHNVTLLQSVNKSPSGSYIAVPHDFDGTGMVNPVYAIPTDKKGIKSTRDRIFLGSCRSKEVFQEELKNFLGNKEKFNGVINNFPYLDQNSKKDIKDFLDQFFVQIEKQGNLENLISIFMNNCKNQKSPLPN